MVEKYGLPKSEAPHFCLVQVVTSGYFGRKSSQVVQESNYGTNRVWTNNPTFLLSGQLTGEQLGL